MFATPENEWKNLFWRFIPRWLAVLLMKVLLPSKNTLPKKIHSPRK